MRTAIVLLVIFAAPGIAQAMDCSTTTSQPLRSTMTRPGRIGIRRRQQSTWRAQRSAVAGV